MSHQISNDFCGSAGCNSCGCQNFCTTPVQSCNASNTGTPIYGSNYLRQLRSLQAAADAIPVRRHTAVAGSSCGCGCNCGCGCSSGCGCHCGCGCSSGCGCHCGCSCDCSSGCDCDDTCDDACDCDCDDEHHCANAQYFGHPAQTVSPGGDLVFTRFSPPDDEDPSNTMALPCGRYLIQYSVNASRASTVAALQADTEDPAQDGSAALIPGCTVTLGIAPKINGVAFPRGGSFSTIPCGGSATLSSTFIVSLPNCINTVGFFNTGTRSTEYQLLNITVTRVC